MEPLRTGKSVRSEFGHPIVKNQRLSLVDGRAGNLPSFPLNLLSHDTFNMTDPNSLQNAVINELNLFTKELSMGR